MPDYLEQHIMTSKQNAFRHLFDLVDELNWVFEFFRTILFLLLNLRGPHAIILV